MDSKLSARQGKTKVEENEESIITLQKLMSCLELPWFSGNPPKWPQFILLFKCLVHDQPLIKKLLEGCSIMTTSLRQP